MLKIVLSEEQKLAANKTGIMRQGQDDDAGIHDGRRAADLSSAEVHILGIKGEIAATLYLELPLENALELMPGGRKVGDIPVPGTGKWVECKTLSRPWYNYLALPASQGKTLRSAAYVMVSPSTDQPVIDLVEFDVVGWISKQEFNCVGEFRTLRFGPQFTVHQNLLRPMGALRNRVRQLQRFSCTESNKPHKGAS